MESRRYLNKIDCRELLTKESFKLFLFEFHNEINRRLGKRLFTLSELENYKRTTTAIVFPYFLEKTKTLSLYPYSDVFLKARQAWFD